MINLLAFRINLWAKLPGFYGLPMLYILFMGQVFLGQQAYGAEISVISAYKNGLYVDESEHTRLRLQVRLEKPPNVFFMAGDKPRIVIDFKNAKLSRGLQDMALDNIANGKSYFTGEGGITKLRFARRGQQGLRFVADLKQSASYVSHSYVDGVFEVLVGYQAGGKTKNTPNHKVHTVPVPVVPVPRLKPSLRVQIHDGIPVPRLKASRRQHLAKRLATKKPTPKKPVIVIDPGHGGKDPGAVGRARVMEEHITLKAAIELRRQLQASGKYKVVLTRASDIYVDHDKRVLIARKAGADLFISLHADSLKTSSARGASVYTLSNRAEARTHKVVRAQNWVLDVDLATTSDPVGNILVDLAQRKTLTKSERFSNILIPELKRSSKLLNNTHRRAGFYVLLAPDVPAVLLEMGFLSNAQDEKLLNTAAHRKKLMKSVARAIDKYFKP